MTARKGIAALALVVVALAGCDSSSRPAARNNGPTSHAIDDRFIPSTTVENGKVVLPVTEPDGARFTIRYPPEMHIAELGFTGYIQVEWPVDGTECCYMSARIAYTNIKRVYGDAKPIHVYRGAHGEDVPLYALPLATDHSPPITEGSPGPTQELAFQFGPWLVRVYASSLKSEEEWIQIPFTEQQLETWARNLSGTVDSHGFLVLHAQAPLTLGNQFSGGFGSKTGDEYSAASNNLTLTSYVNCRPSNPPSADLRPTPVLNGTFSHGHVQWCVEKALHVKATGAPTFLTAALHDLEVSPLRSATEPDVPTTSTVKKPIPSTPSAFATSAYFITAADGWALEQGTPCGDVCTFHIVYTADGGQTWQRRGEVGPMPPYATRIRFADAMRGFAFDAELYRDAPFFETVDGGWSWTKMQAPFAKISDLAITHSDVYVVGVPSTAAPGGASSGFRIWSSPVKRLDWKMDPLVIPSGGGPVPTQQLVLAGGAGWLINRDRGTVSGARLSATTGRWSAWNPPCHGLNGSLGASTNNDVVALCSPGVATPSTKTYIEFSHDGGTSFRQQIVPGGRFGAGGPVTPDARTAVIGQGATLQRTSDDGVTWQVVLSHDPNLLGQGDSVVYGTLVDFGFTTVTQGLIVTDNGAMLMTLDAGVTWQKVILP